MAPHCWVLQGAWLQHGTTRLTGTEECEYRCPRWAWTASGCPKLIRTLPSLAVPQLVELQCPCPIHPAVLAAQWCRSPGRDLGRSVQDVSCPSAMNTSSWECGMPGFGAPLALGHPWLCSAPSLATRMGDGGGVVAGKDVGRSSCCGAGQAPQLPDPGA